MIADVMDSLGTALADELGDRAFLIHLDVADERSWTDAVRGCELRVRSDQHSGKHAGILRFGSVETHDVEELRRVIYVNMTGTLLGMHTARPHMRAAGRGA